MYVLISTCVPQNTLHRYIDRNLADRVGDDPPTIQLRFQHSTADQDNSVDGYYAVCKANCCVVCGLSSHYLRYRVVPQCYRKQLPVPLKSHRSHDIVLLCVQCHEVANRSAERIKRAVAEDYGVPLLPPCTRAAAEQTAAVVACPDGQRVLDAGVLRRSAGVLHRHRHMLPAQRLRYANTPCTFVYDTCFWYFTTNNKNSTPHTPNLWAHVGSWRRLCASTWV